MLKIKVKSIINRVSNFPHDPLLYKELYYSVLYYYAITYSKLLAPRYHDQAA